MALSETELHWIPMNRSKFDQLRQMFDVKDANKQAASYDNHRSSPRIRYSSAENSSALAQIRSLLRPVEQLPDDASSSSSHSSASHFSRSRNTSEDSTELRAPQPPPQQHLQNGVIVLDPVLCSKSYDLIRNENLLIDDTLKQHHSVCETVAEVTENVSVSEVEFREPADPVNCNGYSKLVNTCHSNGDSNPANGATVIGNSGVINGHVVTNGDIKVHVSPEETNGDVQSLDKELLDNGTCVAERSSANKSSVDKQTSETSSLDEEIHGNNSFLKLVDDEAVLLNEVREHFMTLIDEATNASEEAGGRVMAACGKANLLLTSKFKQYRELCYDYEKTSRKVTSDDMQGFWELILLQVADVNRMFTALTKLQESNWAIPKSPLPKKKGTGDVSKAPMPIKKKTREKTAAQKLRDEERRKMLAAKKLEMRQRMQSNLGMPDIIIT